MKIVIVGGGKVGATLSSELSASNDIILIDNNKEVLETCIAENDIQVVLGNGADVDVQRTALVDEADVFLAVTPFDELNIIASIIAKKLGAKYTVARVRSPEYSSSVDFIKSSLGITALINPEEETASLVSEILKYPAAKSIEYFAKGKVNMVELQILGDSFIKDMSLEDFMASFGGRLLVCIVERKGSVFIPTGKTVLKEGDIIHVTGSMVDLDRFYRKLKVNSSPIDKVLIIGGGKLSYYLIKKLLKRDVIIKLIERDLEKCKEFSRDFPNISVINADGTDQDLLEEQGIEEYDSVISLTGIDEENVVISAFANFKKVRKTIAKVNRTSILKLLSQLNIDTVVTPKSIIADKIIRFVRSIGATADSPVQRLYRLADRRVEALEFLASPGSQILGQPLIDLDILASTLVAYIVRDKQIIIPSGKDKILAGDRVVVVSTSENITDLDDIIRK